MILNNKLKKIVASIIAIISVILFISYIHPTFITDEEFTMGLVQHSYKQLININMLDVHPPTYYILLKFFLNVTTFWTQSLLIKIFLGHIFSIIIFLLSFYVLHKIMNLLKIHVNWVIQLILYILLPAISLNASIMRMHGIASLFIILEFYYLIKIFSNDINKYLILIGIYTLIACYMDYFSAVCAGIFLIIYLIKAIVNNKKILAIKIFMLGSSLIICLIPLFIMLWKQSIYRQKFINTSSKPSANVLSIISSFSQSSKLLIPVLIIAMIWSFIYLTKLFNSTLLIVLINFCISNLIAIIVCAKLNVYESLFTYNQFSIYSFFVINILIIMIKRNRTKLKELCVLFLILLICMTSVKKIHNNVNQYIVPSIYMVKNMHNLRTNKSHVIYLNYNKVPHSSINSMPKQVYVTQESIYLNTIDKKLIVTHSSYKTIAKIINYKTILLRKVFNNLVVK